MDPQDGHLWYALGVALISALGSAIGIIGLLVKWVLDARKQRNGHGHLTRDEFSERLAQFRQHLDDRHDSIHSHISDMQENQRRLREDMHVVVSRLDIRLDKLERNRRGGSL